jgi:hypothetical protein
MANLYADEDFFQPVVGELRTFGHDVVTAQEAGRANQGISDEDQLAFATSQGRAVLTRNRWDYIRLHVLVPSHGGIIACSTDHNYAAQAQKIHQALLNHPTLNNQLIRISKS